MNRTIWKRLIWSGVVAAVWCLSMIHAEHVGIREGMRYNHDEGVAYQRGQKSVIADYQPRLAMVVSDLEACRAASRQH